MKLTQSLVAIAALGTLSSTISFAGGDINPVTVFEQEPVVVPVEPVKAPTPPPPPPPPPPAPEALGLYIAGGLTNVAVNSNDTAKFFSDEAGNDRQIGVTGRLGYDFMDYLGAELRGTYGVAKDNGTKFKQVGAYLKPNYDLTDELNLYGLVGASKTNFSGQQAAESGLSYGLGVDYDVADNISVFTDVVNYLKKDNTPSAWGLTLGAAYAF